MLYCLQSFITEGKDTMPKMKNRPRVKVLYVRMPAEDHLKLKILAARREESVGTVVREVITKYLSKEAKHVKA